MGVIEAMNARARNRLIAVTVIILAVAAAVFFGSGAGKGAYSKTVSDAVGDKSLVGKRVRVTGAVVTGSWDKRTNPMRFEIRDENSSAGPKLAVVYGGAPPNTFGNDTVAIVTGEIGADGALKADDMITKCPSKYQTKSGALTVSQLLKSKTNMVGKPTRVAGRLKGGSLQVGSKAPRFVLTGDGADVLPVLFDGAMPEGAAGNVSLVVTGKISQDGTFTASAVAVGK